MRKIFLFCLLITQSQSYAIGPVETLNTICDHYIVQPWQQIRARRTNSGRMDYNAAMFEINTQLLAQDPELSALSGTFTHTLTSFGNVVLARDVKLFTFDIEGPQELVLFKKGTVVRTYNSLIESAKSSEGTEISFRHHRWKVRGLL